MIQMKIMCCFVYMMMAFPAFMKKHKVLGFLKKEEDSKQRQIWMWIQIEIIIMK